MSLAESAGAIIDAVKVGLENTAPELAAGIHPFQRVRRSVV